MKRNSAARSSSVSLNRCSGSSAAGRAVTVAISLPFRHPCGVAAAAADSSTAHRTGSPLGTQGYVGKGYPRKRLAEPRLRCPPQGGYVLPPQPKEERMAGIEA